MDAWVIRIRVRDMPGFPRPGVLRVWDTGTHRGENHRVAQTVRNAGHASRRGREHFVSGPPLVLTASLIGPPVRPCLIPLFRPGCRRRWRSPGAARSGGWC